MKRKLLSLLLATGMAAVLVACGGVKEDSGSATKAETTTAGDEVTTGDNKVSGNSEGRVIGINNWFQGAYALDILVNNAKYVIETNNDSIQILNDEGNAEKLITNLENMVSSNVNGIMWMGMFENNFSVGPQIPNNAGISFAFYDKVPSSEDVRKSICAMEYFAGGVANDNYLAGQSMAETALAEGMKKMLIAGAEVGDPNTDARINGFTEAFEKGGGKILSVSRVATGEANGPQQACDNMLAAYSDADGFYCTGEDFTLAAISVVAKTSSDHTIQIYGTDLNPDLLEYLKSGKLAACSGAHWVSASFAAIMLENAMDGHRFVDENGLPVILDNVALLTITSKYADLYQKYFIDENPYEAEEIQDMLYANNPNVTLKDLEDMITNYSFENRMKAKYKAGKVTADELKKVGIEVDSSTE